MASSSSSSALSPSLSSLSLRGASRPVMKTQKRPKERPTWRATEASHQQPCEGAILVVGPPAPVRPSDDRSPGQHLDCNLMRDQGLEQNAGRKGTARRGSRGSLQDQYVRKHYPILQMRKRAWAPCPIPLAHMCLAPKKHSFKKDHLDTEVGNLPGTFRRKKVKPKQ